MYWGQVDINSYLALGCVTFRHVGLISGVATLRRRGACLPWGKRKIKFFRRKKYDKYFFLQRKSPWTFWFLEFSYKKPDASWLLALSLRGVPPLNWERLKSSTNVQFTLRYIHTEKVSLNSFKTGLCTYAGTQMFYSHPLPPRLRVVPPLALNPGDATGFCAHDLRLAMLRIEPRLRDSEPDTP